MRRSSKVLYARFSMFCEISLKLFLAKFFILQDSFIFYARKLSDVEKVSDYKDPGVLGGSAKDSLYSSKSSGEG